MRNLLCTRVALVCYGYAIKAFISNMYDDNILVGGVFQRPVLYGDFSIQSIGLRAHWQVPIDVIGYN